MPPLRNNLPQLTLGVAFISFLGAASLWLLSPFLLALVWATMIVISTWPLLFQNLGLSDR